MDFETLKLRANIIQHIRDFFIKKSFLEVETPVLSSTLIPDCHLEVFKTDYIDQWSGISRSLYLAPNQDTFMKRLVAQYKCNLFQISKCFRNIEAMTKVHNPEFTMLQFYVMNFNYLQISKLIEEMIISTIPVTNKLPASKFNYISMDDAFAKYAGFKLSTAKDQGSLAYQARNLGLAESSEKPFDTLSWQELFEIIYNQHIIPKLENSGYIAIYNFPAKILDFAQEIPECADNAFVWKERCQMYINGIKIAECRTEEKSPNKNRAYFENQAAQKSRVAKIKHPVDSGYWRIFQDFPRCASASIGIDRLIYLLCGKKSVSEVLSFTL